MTKKLFNKFPNVSAKEWKQKIQADLKGADYNDTLIWHTNEGIDVKPFYHLEVFETLEQVPETKATSWTVAQTIYVDDVTIANKIATDALNRGAETIKFIIPNATVSISQLLNNITAKILYFECLFCDANFIKTIQNHDTKASIYFCTDIIGHLARSGNWYNNLKEDHAQFSKIANSTTQFSVDTSLYQNAGANMVQQLAYTLAHCNEYLNYLNSEKPLQNEKLTLTFNVSVGSNYFFEIAKLRALRTLVELLADAYECKIETNIFAVPTKRNKTLYDYNTNMLRTTSECMSAVLGGANSICNLPYDAIYHKNNEFGDRISRNQLLILKHESYFNMVNNPADGAYYIETLTKQLTEKALTLFKEIETQGGFLSQLKEGIIQRKIKESAQKEQEQFYSGKLVLVGSNKYPNNDDRMKDNLELYPFVKTKPSKTLIEPIIEKRLSETMEQQRLHNE
ncbi:methylmalonyl-CoA mutase subunit beta [Hanstruepera marina]|uniref:methylmalonyl-CoA mutase subunit beta n=1 Tax=Hanstruepera marina TaxID=2873265 RepID=UPI001CA717DA|nr:methylmalonyl-CoA mutase subunit beta [Hanstruepera marina]